MLDGWSSYPTYKAVQIFSKNIKALEHLQKIAESPLPTDRKIEKLNAYLKASVSKQGAFFKTLTVIEIDSINWYEIFRRINQI